jgi:hypothetical protein
MDAHDSVPRINAWIESRLQSGWFNGYPDRHVLLGMWRRCIEMFDADDPPIRGMAIGWVREAWGDPHCVTDTQWEWRSDEHEFSCWVCEPNGCEKSFAGETEIGALVIALEGTPQ